MKSKTLKKIFAAIFFLIILYFFFGADYNIYNLWKYRQKEKDLRSEIQTIDKEKEQLTTEIEMLKSDSAYIEKIASDFSSEPSLVCNRFMFVHLSSFDFTM